MPDHDPCAWRKSSYSGSGGCVEWCRGPNGGVDVRDTKNPDGGTLSFTTVEWTAFLAGVKAGEADLNG